MLLLEDVLGRVFLSLRSTSVASSPGLLCVLLGLAVVVAHRMQPHRLKAFFNQSMGEGAMLEWNPEEGGLLSPHYRSMAESPEPQDIPLSEDFSETCCKEEQKGPRKKENQRCRGIRGTTGESHRVTSPPHTPSWVKLGFNNDTLKRQSLKARQRCSAEMDGCCLD